MLTVENSSHYPPFRGVGSLKIKEEEQGVEDRTLRDLWSKEFYNQDSQECIIKEYAFLGVMHSYIYYHLSSESFWYW